MRNRKRYFMQRVRFSFLVVFIIAIALLIAVSYSKKEDVAKEITPFPTSSLKPSPTVTKTPPKNPIVLLEVPFTVQSPFAEWKDPQQQDACEEASVLMSMHWVRNEPIESKEKAKQELLAIAAYQEDTFGEYRDTSAKDTAERLLKGYYHYTNFTIKDIVSTDDIVAELDQGNLVLVPANGQALGNMSFTQPWPERHMLVVKGYNRDKAQFITNDPGVRQGENWLYDKDILFNAIRDYETGYHVPITAVKKVMIVVRK